MPLPRLPLKFPIPRPQKSPDKNRPARCPWERGPLARMRAGRPRSRAGQRHPARNRDACAPRQASAILRAIGTPVLPGRPSLSCTQSLEKPLHGAPCDALQRFPIRGLGFRACQGCISFLFRYTRQLSPGMFASWCRPRAVIETEGNLALRRCADPLRASPRSGSLMASPGFRLEPRRFRASHQRHRRETFAKAPGAPRKRTGAALQVQGAADWAVAAHALGHGMGRRRARQAGPWPLMHSVMEWAGAGHDRPARGRLELSPRHRIRACNFFSFKRLCASKRLCAFPRNLRRTGMRRTRAGCGELSF